MTATTIRFKRTKARREPSWRCSCGVRSGCFQSSDEVCRYTAQQHSDWHWARGEHSTLELGGLL